MDPRFFRRYLDIIGEAAPTPQAVQAQKNIAAQEKAEQDEWDAGVKANPQLYSKAETDRVGVDKPPSGYPAVPPAQKQTPQGSMSNMPGAKAYSDAADPMAATNAQYQQNMQNIQGEKDQRFLDHMAARDQAAQKYGSVTKALSSGEVDALGPSGDPLERSSVLTTDLKQKEREAGQEYTAANREKTGGGHWQYDKKTVDSEMGPITQTTARHIATPTKGEVIRQGLAGGGSLYDRRSTLLDPNAPPLPPGATGINPTGEKQTQGAVIQPATTQPTAPAPTQPTAPQAAPAPTQPTAPTAPAAQPTTPAAPAAQPTTPAAPTGQPAPTTPVQEEGEEELQKLKEFLQKRY